MCGIAGYVGLAPGADQTLLPRMARQLVHRGPDDEGIVVNGATGLVHRRLAVLDRDAGAQPMRSPDGRWLLAYNGEVYNHQELRDELITLGYQFHTRCDTEVVLAAWSQWGQAAFDRFNGMFALAVADTNTGEVVLARDQFGIKPLYLAADGSGRVAFASELRALLAAAVVPRRPDDVTIYRYLRFRVHDDTERTFFAGITRLLPGQLARIAPDGTVRRETYTTLEYELGWSAAAPRPYDKQAQEEVAAEITAAVRRRLISDVPVGTALSGGIDSSTVVATVNRLLAGNDPAADAVGEVQRTFSAVFPGERNDEERYVDAVAAWCHHHKLDVHKVTPSPDGLLDDLRDFIRTQEEPVISTGPYAQYCVMRQAASHITVMLDGQGADEMMAGYYPYHLVYLRQLVRQRRLLRAGIELVRSSDVLWRMSKFWLADRIRRRRTIPAASVLGSDFVAAHEHERVEVVNDDLKRRLADDLFRHSLPALLRYEDRNTMRFSIEGRVPFLDANLLRLLWALEETAVIRGGWNKRALRDAAVELLPPMVHRRRNKIGFTTPEDAWFARMKNFIYQVLSSDSFAARPYFDQDAAISAFRSSVSGAAGTETMLFWRLLNVELWLREFIDQDPTVPLAASQGALPERDTLQAAAADHAQAPPKLDWLPNRDKQLITEDQRWARFPMRIDLVDRGDDITALAAARTTQFFADLPDAPTDVQALTNGTGWYLYCSEKVVAVAQGRSYFTWEIKPSAWARWLSRYVVRTPHGIGLGDPTTMQLAINEVGLARILFASAASVAGKAIGKRGWFYRITGQQVAAIDGPTQYSAYPANVSAKLAPDDPYGVARQMSAAVRTAVPRPQAERFGGTVIIDANDLGRTVLGHDTNLTSAELVAAFIDNPLGQGREQTPLAVVCALASDHSHPPPTPQPEPMINR